MIIDYAIENNSIVSANNKANSGYLNWKERQEKQGIAEFVEVDTEDLRFTNTSNLKYENGSVIVDEAGIAERAEKERKAQHEREAYAQQDSFFTPNKRHLFDGVVYNAPPADMDLLPKMNSYRVFMKALWTEYHTRIANGSTDYDYSEFAPETEYSYVELEQEWVDYNQVS